MDQLPNELILVIYDNFTTIYDRLKYSIICKRHYNVTEQIIKRDVRRWLYNKKIYLRYVCGMEFYV